MFAELRSARLDCIYLWLCAPIFAALIYILPPFQSPDEAAHFFRAIQLSRGEVTPILAGDSYRPGAGAAVDRPAYRLVRDYCPDKNWSCPVQDRPPLADIVQRDADTAIEAGRVTAFSNTVIYLPVAHVVPAAAIALVRSLGLPALGWFYAGRIANGLFALCATWLALRLLRGRRAALPVFTMAALPMTLSIAPTFSADSGVISCSLLLAALCLRLLEGGTQRWLWPLLIMAVLFAAAAKIAYLPLAFMPVASALAGRAPRRIIAGTLLVSLGAVAVTLGWSSAVHAYVFSISPDLLVDIPAQIAFLRDHPIYALHVLLTSMVLEAPRALVQLVGWKSSSFSAGLPSILVALPIATLAVAFAIGGTRQPRSPRLFALLVVLACAAATFLFLYIQNTPVGEGRVAGYQGRYLLPILPFLTLVIPRWASVGARREGHLRTIVVASSALTAIAVTLFSALRVWH